MLVSWLLTFHCCLTGHWLIVSVVPKNPSFFDEEAIFPWRPQLVLASFSIGATTKYSWTWRSSDNLDSQNLCWLGEVCCCLFRLIQKNPSFFFKEATHTRSKLNPSFTCVASWTPVSLVSCGGRKGSNKSSCSFTQGKRKSNSSPHRKIVFVQDILVGAVLPARASLSPIVERLGSSTVLWPSTSGWTRSQRVRSFTPRVKKFQKHFLIQSSSEAWLPPGSCFNPTWSRSIDLPAISYANCSCKPFNFLKAISIPWTEPLVIVWLVATRSISVATLKG